MSDTPEKLTLIRALMEQKGVDAYIVPDTDPHLGEYIPDHWRILRWLTGFTGSAGTLLITDSAAYFWTDSRYVVQAERQLSGSGIEIIKTASQVKSDYLSWLHDNLEPHSTVGFDGRIVSVIRMRRLKQILGERDVKFDPECDFISQLWVDRPVISKQQAFDHPVVFSGKDRNQKLKEVREEMKRYDVDYHLLTSPDDIMWLLNIRAGDVKHTPLLMSFAIVGSDQVLLFAEEEKIPPRLAREFDNHGIILLPYEETAGILSTLKSRRGILVSPATTSEALYSAIPGRLKIKEDVSIPARMKAVKNSTEISCLGKAMIRDGVALTKFFHRIGHDNGVVPMSELSLTHKLDHIRSGLENFLCCSFPTIVAYNAHAALPHYTASAETDSVIGQEGILLVDSGGQYLDGTTDITRTIAIGKPSEKQKKDFTLVLRGMISLATASFPSGTFGHQLDILARRYLWEHGLNYGHGTGHGVGYCLNVHEGPHRISVSAATDPGSYITPGMIVSDEPAVYREGEYGIRTENLLLCYEDEETEFGIFNKFSTLSLCYIDTSLIDLEMLDSSEISWLNRYHEEVYDKISPYLNPEEREWLKLKTRKI